MEDKEWYKAQYINKIELVFSLYPQLSLTPQQLVVVLAILWAEKNSQEINIEKLGELTRLNKEEINSELSALSQKGYLTIKTKNKKVEFSLEGLFEGEKQRITALDNNLFALFEQEFGRTLSPNELQMLVDLKSRYKQEELVEALRCALIYDKRSMNYVAKVLSSQAKKNEENNQNT